MSNQSAVLGDVSRLPAGRTVLILLAAAVIAVALNTMVSLAAVALGAPATYVPLTLPVYGAFSVVGVLVGWIGWRLVQRVARHPRRVLAVLVPVVAVLSFVPDLLLLVFGFIPGTTPIAVTALVVMHVVGIGVAVPAYLLASRN